MKKLCLALVFIVCLCSSAIAQNNELIVYNWSEYIPQDVLDTFTKETGIKVTYSTFESNEAMYAKVKLLRGTGYDIIVPSTYLLDLLRTENLLAKIDKSKLPNYSNLSPSVLSQSFDPENDYSIPYMWNGIGIIVNKKYADPASITSWEDLLRPEFKGKVFMTDDMRDAYGIFLKATGSSANSLNPEEIKTAYEWGLKLKPSIRIFDVSNAKQAFISEEVVIGAMWNGDTLIAQDENPDLTFVYPKEGIPLWLDSFTIPVGAKNVDNAHAFINFMLRPDIAARCAEEFRYSTPNTAALALLPDELKDNPIYTPPADEMKKAEFIHSIGETLHQYEQYWEKIKVAR